MRRLRRAFRVIPDFIMLKDRSFRSKVIIPWPCRRGSGVWPPKELKYVYESTAFHKEGSMGEIEFRRPHSIKLADIHLKIFIESVGIQNLPQLCTNDVIYGSLWDATPSTTHTYPTLIFTYWRAPSPTPDTDVILNRGDPGGMGPLEVRATTV